MLKFNLLSSFKLLNRQCIIKRYLKSIGRQQNYSQLIKKSPNDFEVQESEDLNFNYQEMEIPKDLEMNKIANLDLKNKLEQISKPGIILNMQGIYFNSLY